jgi:hypothetical protein
MVEGVEEAGAEQERQLNDLSPLRDRLLAARDLLQDLLPRLEDLKHPDTGMQALRSDVIRLSDKIAPDLKELETGVIHPTSRQDVEALEKIAQDYNGRVAVAMDLVRRMHVAGRVLVGASASPALVSDLREDVQARA